MKTKKQKQTGEERVWRGYEKKTFIVSQEDEEEEAEADRWRAHMKRIQDEDIKFK